MLSGLSVVEAMRRQVIRLPKERAISDCIATLIKYKINALLVTADDGMPAGVVSKTDIMGAYYAELPLESPVEHIMSSPPLFCRADKTLESALETMRSRGVYRLYITEAAGKIVGTLAYPDIVGRLYQYCRRCEYSRFSRKGCQPGDEPVRRIQVKDVMTVNVKALSGEAALTAVMEALSTYRFGAVLINTGDDGPPLGVISKTDLALTYKHGLDVRTTAETIMSAPVQSCDENAFLEEAIRKMIFSDVQRLFVHRRTAENIVGVFSLSDAARLRSGSCQACVSSRIKVDEHH